MLSYFYFCFSLYLLSRSTHLLLDKEKRIVGVLAGCPDGSGWQDTCSRAFSILQRVAKRVQPNQDELKSRRGIGKYVSYGISLGNGQKVSAIHLSIYFISSANLLTL